MFGRKVLNIAISLMVLTSLMLGGTRPVGAEDANPPPPSHDVADIKARQAARITNEQRLAAAERETEKAGPQNLGRLNRATTGSKTATKSAMAAMPAAPAQGGVPNYFGPESNWANSPMHLPDALVDFQGDGTGATATATVDTLGTITAITLTAGGSGYTTAPTIVISSAAATTGSGAAATATIAGTVANLALANGGSGYTAPAVVTFTGDGTGAAADAVVDPVTGAITGLTLTNPGAGYTSAPAVSISGGAGSGAVVTATISGAVTAVTLVSGGSGYITPGIRKFVDSLPGLGATNANNLGQYIPVGVPDTTTYPGSDYYEIELGQYTEKMHTDLLPTTLRGYRQTNMGGTPFSYLGPIIVASKDTPVRIKFTNKLPTGAGGDLFLPVDTTEMGAGMGPLGMNTTPGYPMDYTQNRATLHLHGGLTPWISDGTPHQWTTPAGEQTDYPKGVSVENVPDMPDPGPGSLTFFYSNQQSARLMFYHDHAYGITRLNVYAGEAAGYVLTDPTEQDLIARGILPDVGTPLIIQDKTFIDPGKLLANDPTWPFAIDATKSNLWYPHVYMPNQNPNDLEGVNPLGRWDYGPWFWPPWVVTQQPITDPATGMVLPNLPNLSMTMEAYMDTPVVNGTVYPYMDVQPKTYRFRVLNAANDRMWNLQMYVADPAAPTEVRMVPAVQGAAAFPAAWTAQTTGMPGDILDGRTGGVPDPALIGPSMIQIGTEGGFLPAPVVLPNIPLGYDRDPKSITVGNVKEHNLWLGPAERADVLVDFSQFAGKTIILYNDSCAACPATDSRMDYYTGDVDQTAIGGAPTTLPGYGPNTRTIMQFRVGNGSPQPYNLAALQSEFASTATSQGVFARSQDPIIVPQGPYNSAYNANFPVGTTAYSRIQNTSLTFTPIGATAPVTINFGAKAIQELFENTYGRMSAYLGVELPFTNGINQTTIDYGYIDPPTEVINDTPNLGMTQIGALGDGTQIWKITHNGVDTHPIHFHLFNVQLLNRVDWAGVVKPPDANELGWKETVKMSPLEDAIVALRATAPKIPFGVPDSIRPLDPTMPLGSTMGFRNIDPSGNPVTTVNQLVNYGWEYVWHCHILSHEEMDMMRPIVFNVARSLPIASVLSANVAAGAVNLTWTDGTPAATSLGNPANEIGFRIERSVNGGAFAPIGQALANATAFTDSAIAAGSTYQYQVIAFNAAGETPSNVVTVIPPPVVVSINRASANPTNAASVNYAVTFSAAVTGVDVTDFVTTLTGGIAGVTVTSVTGTGTTYTVAVNTGTGSGTLRLDLSDNDTILGAGNVPLGGAGIGNGNFTTGQVYTVDKSFPTVVSVVRASPNPTNAASVNYTVTFSMPVTGVNASDFTTTLTGTVRTVSIASVTGSGTTYTVAVNTGLGSGTLGLNVIDNDSIISAAGIPLGGVGAGNGNFNTGEVYTIDKTAPTVVSINRASANPTTAASVNYTVRFSEAVTGVDVTDFAATVIGLSGASVTSVTGTGTTYTVAVNTGTGTGNLRLDLRDNNSIIDVASNPLGGPGINNFTTGQAYSIDRTPPTVVSINRASANPTILARVNYTVTFSEAVTGVNASDFALTVTRLTGTSVVSVTGNGARYTVVVNTGTGTRGTLRLDLIDNNSIIDAASNPLGGPGINNFTTGQVYSVR